MVPASILPRNDRDRISLHRHDRDALIFKAPPNDNVCIIEHMLTLSVAEAGHTISFKRVVLGDRVSSQRSLHIHCAGSTS